jgi:protocatechuate 3,4-dioxygenase beta subunit
MRSLLLGIVVTVLAAGLAGLWFLSNDDGIDTIHASGSGTFEAEDQGVSALTPEGNAATGEPDRVPIAPVAPVEVPTENEDVEPLSGQLHGRVVDAQGTGIPEARVFASSGEYWIKLPLDMETDGQQNDWFEIHEATTDSEGHFVFEQGLKSGKLRMVFRAAGFQPRYEDHLNLPDELPHVMGDMALDPGVVLKGQVIDRYGDGVAGATLLQALERGVAGVLVTIPGRGIPLATTAKDGSFVVDELPSGPWRLIVDAPGCVVREETGRTEAAEDIQDGLLFVVDPGEEIHGLIKDAPAEFVAELRIEARAKKDRNRSNNDDDEAPVKEVHPRVRQAWPDAEGKFVIGGLAPAEEYRITAWEQDEKHGWKRSRAVKSKDAFSGSRGIELEFQLESRLMLEVVDKDTQEPVEDYLVWAGLRNRSNTVLVDDEDVPIQHHPGGKSEFGNLRPGEKGGEAKIRVRAVGYEDFEKDKIQVDEGADVLVEKIELKAASRVHVTVLDAASAQPVAGARVYLVKADDDNIQWYMQQDDPQQALANSNMRYGETDENGKVALGAIVGEASRVYVQSKGYLKSEAEEVFTQSSEDSTVEVRLNRGGIIMVEVVDTEGKPVANAKVEHRQEDGEEESNDDYFFGGGEQGEVSDDDGLVRYASIPAGSHAFRIKKQEAGYAWDEGEDQIGSDWKRVMVAEGEEQRVQLITAARGSLRGIVTEARVPLGGATLTLESEEQGEEPQGDIWFDGSAGSNPYSTLSSHDGSFQFKDVRCGEYILIVTHPDRKQRYETHVTIVPEGGEELIDLPLAVIEGMVMDREGMPIPNLDVRVSASERSTSTYFGGSSEMTMIEDENGNLRANYGNDWRRRRIRTNSEGRYRIRGVYADRPLTVSVSGGYVISSQVSEIMMAPDEIRRDVDFVLERAGQARIRMPKGVSTGRTWLQARLKLIDGEGGQVQSTSTSVRAGRTRTLRSLRAGTWKLTLKIRGAAQDAEPLLEREVEIRVGEVTRVQLDL